MSTPRTDAALCIHPRHPSGPMDLVPFGTIVTSDFARTLEQELTDAQTNIQKLREALEAAEQYLVERGVEVRGTVGRTKILPMIRKTLEETK